MQEEQTFQSQIKKLKVECQNIYQFIINIEEIPSKNNPNQGNELQIKENQEIENEFAKNTISSELTNNSKLAEEQKNLFKICRILNTGGSIAAMAISENGQTIVTAKSQNIQIWNLNKGILQKSQKLLGHTASVKTLYYSHKNDWFISWSRDRTFRIWEIQANEWICKQIIEIQRQEQSQIVLNKEEDQLFFSNYDGIIIWKKTQEWIFFQKINGINHLGFSLCLNPDCDQLAYVGAKTIWLWDCNTTIWKFHQNVHSEQQHFLRVCLIGKNDIIATFQPKDAYLYRIIESFSGKFEIRQKLLLSPYFDFDYYFKFPIKYCPKERLVVCRHGWEYTYVLIQNTEGNFEIKKVFEGDYEDGYLSYDGKYLILAECRDKTLEIYQLRKQ